MKAVIGLGNPGKEYADTRHNVGFAVVDELARRAGVTMKKSLRLNAVTGETTEAGVNVMLVKPQTFMNQSGVTVANLARREGVKPEDLLVVFDDVDLEPGVLRIRKKGSAGGHNGLQSIIDHVGTNEFVRLRVGVGKPKGKGEMIGHVLSRFGRDEAETIRQVVERTVDAIVCIMNEGVDQAMNKFNGSVGGSNEEKKT